jgi:hypothetical protein
LLAVELAEMNADRLANAFNSIRFYLGTLNRDVNDARVAAYRAEMDNGAWWFTPDPVVVADTGDILNGQHRLLAVEAALTNDSLKTAPQFVVVWGVDKRAALLMDEARRTATDRRDIALRYARANGS